MKDNKVSQVQILEIRRQNLQQDLDMIEAQKKRLNEEGAVILLKLIAQREQLLALKEQDE